jgi:hypothetical protein
MSGSYGGEYEDDCLLQVLYHYTNIPDMFVRLDDNSTARNSNHTAYLDVRIYKTKLFQLFAVGSRVTKLSTYVTDTMTSLG